MTRLCVVGVADATRAPATLDFSAVSAWFEEISFGRCRVSVAAKYSYASDGRLGQYRLQGGMGSFPCNSQALMHAMLEQVDGAMRTELARGASLVAVVPSGFHPHVWRLRRGGFNLGAGAWLRRYAVVPETASLGEIAHELGHLLFGWPDLQRTDLGEECLMARGAARKPRPAPPCAPLLLQAGWRERLPLTRNTTIADLTSRLVGSFHVAGREFLVERRPSTLLLYAGEIADRRLLVRRMAISAADSARPLLGVLAHSMRSLLA